jgi:hypothetical protein
MPHHCDRAGFEAIGSGPRSPGLHPGPGPRPLTRSLVAELGRGPRTLAVLKDHALTETVYRPPHARTVVQDLLRRGAIDRESPRGHLTDGTLIRLAGRRRATRRRSRRRSSDNRPKAIAVTSLACLVR